MWGHSQITRELIPNRRLPVRTDDWTCSTRATIQDDTQTCTLPGSVAGSNVVSGLAYVEAAFSYRKGHLWRNFGILIAFFIAFALMQVIAMEFLAKGAAAVKVSSAQHPNV